MCHMVLAAEAVVTRMQMWLVFSEVNFHCLASQLLSLQTCLCTTWQTCLCTTWQEMKHQRMQMDVSMD